jgi:hypothetical protein
MNRKTRGRTEEERDRKEDIKYKGRNRGSTGKKTRETNGQRIAQQGQAKGKNINRRKHRWTTQHALAIAFIPFIFVSSFVLLQWCNVFFHRY